MKNNQLQEASLMVNFVPMTPEQLELLRLYVQAEIEYEFARRDEGADGYGVSATNERKAAERAFNDLVASLAEPPDDAEDILLGRKPGPKVS